MIRNREHNVVSFLPFFPTDINFTLVKYQSDQKQDRYVNEQVFKNFRGGKFVDIGAFDGIRNSNSYFFEKELGWNGICVEPNPEMFQALKKNRDCICVEGCVSNEVQEKPFMKITGYPAMQSGLIEKYDPVHLQVIENMIASHGGIVEIIPRKCFLLNDLLEQNGIDHVEFLSIDTEGGEYDILSSIDYKKFHIDVITVENNYGDPRYIPFLENQGFRLAHLAYPDMIFINTRNIFISKIPKP